MEKALKVGLIDDNEEELNYLKELIKGIDGYEVSFASKDPHFGLRQAQNGNIDILFTDIVIPEMGGLEITTRLGETDIPVIFCSGHDRFALAGYQLDVVYYITKPPATEEIKKGLEKAREKLDRVERRATKTYTYQFIIVNGNGGYTGEVVNLEEMIYLDHASNLVTVHTANEKFFVVKSLLKIMEEMNFPYLFRIHQSYAINVLHLKKISFYEVTMSNGDKVPIGRTYSVQFQKFLSNKKLFLK